MDCSPVSAAWWAGQGLQTHQASLSPARKWICQFLSWLLAEKRRHRVRVQEVGVKPGFPSSLVFYTPQNNRKMIATMKIADVY